MFVRFLLDQAEADELEACIVTDSVLCVKQLDGEPGRCRILLANSRYHPLVYGTLGEVTNKIANAHRTEAGRLEAIRLDTKEKKAWWNT